LINFPKLHDIFEKLGKNMRKIDIEEAKKQPEALFSLAADEEEIMITANEQPLFKLVRFHQPLKRRQRGSAKDLISISPDFEQPLEEFKEYMS